MQPMIEGVQEEMSELVQDVKNHPWSTLASIILILVMLSQYA